MVTSAAAGHASAETPAARPSRGATRLIFIGPLLDVQPAPLQSPRFPSVFPVRRKRRGRADWQEGNWSNTAGTAVSECRSHPADAVSAGIGVDGGCGSDGSCDGGDDAKHLLDIGE